MESTEWRPVVGYEGLYEVSSAGHVKRLRRGSQYPAGSLLTEYPLSRGHVRVRLYREKVGKLFLVHRLVAFAFIGEPEPEQEVCHRDGNPLHNNLSNLRWGTRSDNMQDRVRHGNHPNASKTHCIHGHGFTTENTYVNGKARICRTCQRENWARYDKKRRQH